MAFFRQVLRLIRQTPGASALVLLGLVVSSVGQVAMLASLYPALQAVTGAAPQGRLARAIASLSADLNAPPPIGLLLLFAVAVALVFSLLSYAADACQMRYVRRYETRLRQGLLDAVLHAEWEHLRLLPHGELVNVLSTEVDQAKLAIKHGFGIIEASLQVLALFLFAAYLHWAFALVAVGVFALAALPSFPFFILTNRAASRRVATANELSVGVLTSLRASKAIKANSLEDYALGAVSHGVEKLAATVYELKMLGSGQIRVNDFLGLALAAGLLYIGSAKFAIPVSTLILQMGVFARILPILKGALSQYGQGVAAMPSIALIDRTLEAASRRRVRSGGRPLSAPVERIEVEGVSFSAGGRTLFDGLSFTIPRGQTWLFAGPTGSGKTTLLDVILGLVPPKKGTVRVNGVALEQADLASWHRCLGYVAQDSFAFEGTLRDNLSWGLKEPVSDEKLLAAARRAQLGPLVDGAPGLDRAVFEGGNNLSGGEKQRIALARLFLRDVDLLIFDEPTSALDKRTEEQFLEILRGLRGKATVLVVSHEPKFRELADKTIDLGHA
jgi:ATP-binding cassette, subfamily C, bacterial